VLSEIRNAVTACRQAEPDLLVRLKQHISIRAMIAGMQPDQVARAMEGPSFKNAYFWRLFARGLEENKGSAVAIAGACSGWEEFRRHAVHEGWFPAQGPEAATLYLHMADLLRHLGPEDQNALRRTYERQFDGHAGLYKGQPPEIRMLMPGKPADLYYLSPDEVLDRACRADPRAENFQRWLA